MLHAMKKQWYCVEFSLVYTLQKIEYLEKEKIFFFSFKVSVGEQQPIPRVFE